MNLVEVKSVRIGEGIPKICVPIIGSTKEEIINEAKELLDVPVDVAEWRADWFGNIFDIEQVKHVLVELRKVLKEIPLLFTFRTSKEGGERELQLADYAELNKAVMVTGNVDLVDVELFAGEKIVKEIIEEARKNKVKVVVSNHDFHKTPEKDEIIKRLRKMQELGADIPKIAVMPQNRKDILTLLIATEEMNRKYADRPIVTMSMSGVGVISRVCGEVFGSALTFGAIKKASAPGQMNVEELKMVLDVMHKNFCIKK